MLDLKVGRASTDVVWERGLEVRGSTAKSSTYCVFVMLKPCFITACSRTTLQLGFLFCLP